MRILVINAYPERRAKYLSDKRYELIDCYPKSMITDNEILSHRFLPAASLDYKKKRISCYNSHLMLLEYIIAADLKDTIIMEDDAIIDDWAELNKVMESEEPCYIGGSINSLKQKDNKYFKENTVDSVRKTFVNGFNDTAGASFRVLSIHGYYIPDADSALKIHNVIFSSKNKKKPYDVELNECIRKFYYPAISVLNVEEAKKGFTGYFVKDNMKYY